jgi:conjugative relaxase-like TrwC/TraI family protein
MLTIRAMTGGAGYAQRHLEHSDYYDEHRKVQGEWHGHGAELLGLHGQVTREQFESVREGLHPETGEFLRPRHSADRLGTDGSEQSKGRSLYDLTFSAPKSVSVQALVGGDKRLIAAHDRGVREALAEAERYSATRIRLNGANDNRITGNLIAATFRHDTSRELDPQLHTHAVTANLTYDGVEGRWKALQASDLYERRAYLTEVYRNTLAHEVRSLGYNIEQKRDSRGRDYGFEIRGISGDLLERYSQRSAQRDAAIEQFNRENGRKPTDNEVAVLVRESRADKLVEISTEQVRQRQQERLSPTEARTLELLRFENLDRKPARILSDTSELSALSHAKEHLFERNSVVHAHELLTEALRYGRGDVDLGRLQGALQVAQAEGSILRVGERLATRDSLEREQRMVATVNRGMNRYDCLRGERDFEPSQHLREEQRRAVNHILDSRDIAMNLRGAAGTGKTATLQEIDRGVRAGGCDVMAIAPTRSAVEELQKVGFREAMTVSRLLEDQTAQATLRGRLLIVDEAGMISGRQMEAILKLVESQHARILFSGDTRQISSVEASDALRILERESQLKSVSLTGVQRQSNAQYRDAIQTLRDSPERGFEKLEKLGAVREVPGNDRPRAVADLFREMTTAPARKILVVAPTHAEIERVTQAIRTDRSERGLLGESVTMERLIPMQWTEAQKRDLSNYHEGQILLVHRSGRGMEKHEALIVHGVEQDNLVARNARGEERTFTSGQTRNFSVHEAREIQVAGGDRLLLTGNRRDESLRATNGELVTVQSVNAAGIQLEDGRTLPPNYREFDHGYAVTAHRSQGKTVDGVILSGDVMKQELFYVAASRGRSEIAIVTSDRELLRESLGISTARPSATELAKELERSHLGAEHEIAHVPIPPIEQRAPQHEIRDSYELGIGF